MNLFGKRIYLDYAAATPLDEDAAETIEKYLRKFFHNPSTIYREGVTNKDALERLRRRVADLVGAGHKDIVFTSGGTESDNLAILGAFEAFLEFSGRTTKRKSDRPHIIVSAIEHSAVMMAAQEVQRRGGELSIAPVDRNGFVSPEEIFNLIGPSTFMVTVMFANNEIGTIEPVSRIGRLIREYRRKNASAYPLFHTDASQAFNYLDVNVEALHADLLSIDGSKIYGPKGSGLLVVRPLAKIRPILVGGGQEGGKRAGTENLPLIAGFVEAMSKTASLRQKESKRISAIRTQFVSEIRKRMPTAEINGPENDVLPNIVSVSVAGILAELLVLELDRAGIMASVGSACSLIGTESGSDVIRAIGKNDLSESTVRFSFGRSTTLADAMSAAKTFSKICVKIMKQNKKYAAI